MVTAIATPQGRRHTPQDLLALHTHTDVPRQALAVFSPHLSKTLLTHVCGPGKFALREGLTQTTDNSRKFKIMVLTTALTYLPVPRYAKFSFCLLLFRPYL